MLHWWLNLPRWLHALVVVLIVGAFVALAVSLSDAPQPCPGNGEVAVLAADGNWYCVQAQRLP